MEFLAQLAPELESYRGAMAFDLEEVLAVDFELGGQCVEVLGELGHGGSVVKETERF